jgi:gamma-glutamylcyclotransferase (GGCT)/AIG2-like uncharacterized protein YtfP
MIVVGTPTVPADQIEQAERSGEHNYIGVPVRVENCLKGNPCPETIVVREFTRGASRTLVESSGNQSVLFLIQVDTQTITKRPEIYFAGNTPKAIQPYSEELIRQVGMDGASTCIENGSERTTPAADRAFYIPTSASMTHRLFVYGTLAPGRPNEHVLADVPGEWEPATAIGTLLQEGWGAAAGYPGIVLDEHGGGVEGFVFSSKSLAEHWARLDEFEGEGYERVLTTVKLKDGTAVEAYIYRLRENGSPRSQTGRS